MAGGTYSVEASSTLTEAAPHERADFWSEHVTSYHSRLDYRFPHGGDFDGQTVRQCTDTYQLVEFWSDTITYRRTAHQVRRDPDEDYRFLVPLTGELLVRQEGHQARLSPGIGSLITLHAPFDLSHDSSTRAFIMTIPTDEVNERLDRSSPLAAGLDLTSGLGRVVRDMLIGLSSNRDDLTGVQFDAISDRLVELLCMLIVGDDRPTAPGHLPEVEAMVRRHVRLHAADPGMNGAVIANALGWSLRQVQLALHQVGTTPRDLIREERLRLVWERLQDPGHAHMSITELAYASGFSSPSALSTAFRQHYGVTPRELRNEAVRSARVAVSGV